MVFSASLGAVLLARQTSIPVDTKELLRQRMAFDSDVKDPKHRIGYTRVGSETLGGAHGDALFPIGSAKERYMLSFDERETGELIYEKRTGSIVSIVWHVPFTKSKSKAPVAGTVPKYLQKLGFRITPKAHLRASAQKQLAQVGTFASYGYHHMMGGFASIIQPNGDKTKMHQTEDAYSITPEEKSLLKSRSTGS